MSVLTLVMSAAKHGCWVPEVHCVGGVVITDLRTSAFGLGTLGFRAAGVKVNPAAVGSNSATLTISAERKQLFLPEIISISGTEKTKDGMVMITVPTVKSKSRRKHVFLREIFFSCAGLVGMVRCKYTGVGAGVEEAGLLCAKRRRLEH